MEKLKLNAKSREISSRSGKKIRKEGLIPAVLYGHKIQNQNVTVNLGEFEKVLRKAGESTIIDLVTEDGKNHSVLIHDIQYHYLTSEPIHADFYEVSMTEKLKAKIALEFIGESPAVKTLGGVLVKVLNEIEVECLPADLPHSLEVNLAKLAAFTDSILAKDIAVPAKVKITTPAQEVVAKVQPPRDVEAELAAPVVEDVSKVEGAAEVKPEAPAASDAKKEEKA